ncbi:hypothetical protein GYA37_03480 [candidate division WWE3 bacterium]|uniref:Uncharacterized protein n=1 Tax=candidate division WWE3 bacterium TaxID=2053526 RepID=A0A7X9E7M7_UNCKA|nr:hypothetical protein [candidate division WWE3 bacterium]
MWYNSSVENQTIKKKGQKEIVERIDYFKRGRTVKAASNLSFEHVFHLYLIRTLLGKKVYT